MPKRSDKIRRIEVLGSYGRAYLHVELHSTGEGKWKVMGYQRAHGRYIEIERTRLADGIEAVLQAFEAEGA